MTFLEFPIKRYPFTLVAFLGLIALGVYAFNSIARSEDPYFPIPAFVISAVLPGGDPVEMERLISKPIEDRLAELDDIKRIDSTSSDGLAVIVPEFIAGVDVERKYEEIVREINALRPDLPAEIVKLEIRKVNPGLVNIVQMALVSEDAPYAELEDLARTLKELRYAFKVYSKYRDRRKVTVFGSARTSREHAEYAAAEDVGRLLVGIVRGLAAE